MACCCANQWTFRSYEMPEFDYPKSRCGACACASHPTGQGPGQVRPSAGVSLTSPLAVSRQCLLNPHGRLRTCPRWNARRYPVRPSSGWIRRIRVHLMILLCAILSAAHFPQSLPPLTHNFRDHLPWRALKLG